MTIGAHDDYTFAERLAQIREQKGDTLLESRVDDKRNIVVGHVVTESIPEGAGYAPATGIVVERWVDPETGEPGVVIVEFRQRGGEVNPIIRRFKVDELRQDHLPWPDPYACATTARMLYKCIGQGIKRNGRADPLSDFERRLARWADALDNAGMTP